MKRVLITGAGGFCGHHFVDHFIINTDWQIVAMTGTKTSKRILDSKHYQDNPGRVEFLSHDLREPVSDEVKIDLGKINYIVNLASLSHIEDSIANPSKFILDNVLISLNVYELARAMDIEKIIQFSSDEIYGPIINDTLHKEWSPIVPANPYSASKAAQEDVAIAYWKTYNVPLIITNTMSVIGERQGVEKYVPKIIKTILSGDTLTIHSKNGQAGFRSYLHARNAADAVMFILNDVEPVLPLNSPRPERINIANASSLDNLRLAQKISEMMEMPLKYDLVDVSKVRPGQDYKYGLDGSKLNNLGYKYPVDFESSLHKTVKWMSNPENKEYLN